MQLPIESYHLSIFIFGTYFLGFSEENNRITRTKRIVGGVKAKPNEFPWHVVIRMGGRRIAGGVLINSRWVLTAGHVLLIDADPNCPRDINDIYAILGALTRKQITNRYNVICIKTHDCFLKGKADHDIGVMKLAEEVKFKDSIKTACLINNARNIEAGTLVTIAGFGRRNNSVKNSKSNQLYKVDLQYIEGRTCKDHFYNYITTDNVCCAGIDGDFKGAAQGDSGGGVFLKNTNYVIGIISSRLNILPTVIVRVDKFHDWIIENTEYIDICWID